MSPSNGRTGPGVFTLFRISHMLLACGVISSALYVIAIDVIVALRHPGYHNFSSQMVSELMAVGSPTRGLLTWLFIPYNVMAFAFAAGVWAVAGTRRSARIMAAAATGYAVISTVGLLFAPMDVRGTVDSQRDPRHIAVTFVMSMFVVAMMASGAFIQGMRFRMYTFATLAVVLVFGIISGILSRPMPAATPGVGLAERVNIYATMLWIAAVAIHLMQLPRTDAAPAKGSRQGTIR